MSSPAQPGEARQFSASTHQTWRALLARPDEGVRVYVFRGGRLATTKRYNCGQSQRTRRTQSYGVRSFGKTSCGAGRRQNGRNSAQGAAGKRSAFSQVDL